LAHPITITVCIRLLLELEKHLVPKKKKKLEKHQKQNSAVNLAVSSKLNQNTVQVQVGGRSIPSRSWIVIVMLKGTTLSEKIGI
jgi:hypothetical protein